MYIRSWSHKDTLQCLDLVLCLCEELQVFGIVTECKAMSQNDIQASVEAGIHWANGYMLQVLEGVKTQVFESNA